MLDLYRNKNLEKKIGKLFSHLPITPNQYTLTSILFAFFCFYFLIKEDLILALVFFLIASFLDFIDGSVARYKNISTKIGSYLDTIADRYVEGILLLAMLFLPLPKIFLPSYIWIFLILFGSIMTTYTKAAAKEKGLVEQELKHGFLLRGERIILFIISLILGIFNYHLMVYILIIIVIFSNFTVLQRINLAIRLKQN